MPAGTETTSSTSTFFTAVPPVSDGLEQPERSQPEQTRREDRHLNFYATRDNLHTSRTERSPRNPANTISSFCCAVNFLYFRCSLNLVSLSVERPILSPAPDGLSGATPLQDRPAHQASYLSTPNRGAGHDDPKLRHLTRRELARKATNTANVA